MPAANASCVVLVPAFQPPVPRCEEGLRELERRGYTVRRVRGFSAIDQGRNQMVSDALLDGFAETMWIDVDIGFEADDVERLRSRELPMVAGIYPQPGSRAVACHLLPETPELVFGKRGGLVEIKYAAAGFLHVRREAYETIRDSLKLPLCNTRFGRGVWPFFQPMAVADGGVQRYLAEEYAFSHRARQAGFKIMADTSIRLWRYGTYPFSWEDAGGEQERFATFHFHIK
jgi:hypothetical protein